MTLCIDHFPGILTIENKTRIKSWIAIEKIRHLMRVQHYAIRTEQAYVDWIRRFILYHGKRHPDEMGEQEVSQFLTHLVVNRNVAPATRGQALNALVFLYRKVLNRPLDQIEGIVRSKKKTKIPVVLSQSEVASLLACLEGIHWLAGFLLYGSGLRLPLNYSNEDRAGFLLLQNRHTLHPCR